jgi:DNA-binding LytR/AlgR family response regulator
MNIVIVEDEVPASSKLEQLILRYDESFKILKVLRNIEDSVDFFANIKEKIDLIFMDIQLTDGTSFEIFKQVELKTPIIFTTAYNEYAIEAFKSKQY